MKSATKFGVGLICIIIVVITLWAGDVLSLIPVREEEKPAFVEVDDKLQFVSGTEYFPGQEGQVAVMIVNAIGDVVTSEYNCTYDVLYPDKTLFINGSFNASTVLGTYYTNFTVPDVDGVYEYGSTCTKGGKTAVAGKSFHVTKKNIRAVMIK